MVFEVTTVCMKTSFLSTVVLPFPFKGARVVVYVHRDLMV